MKCLRVRRLNSSILFIGIIAIAVFVAFVLTGCQKKKLAAPGATVSGTYFDTLITITAYDNTPQDVLDGAIDRCAAYEKIFSKTDESSELYAINHRMGGNVEGNTYSIEVSDDMYEVLSCAVKYAKDTELAFNPALGSVISLWDYHSEHPTVPSQTAIDEALKVTDPFVIEISEDGSHTISMPMDGTQLDLGGIAKGYIADELKKYLVKNGCSEAVIMLGGNVYCMGNKNNQGYSVGIQKPFESIGTYVHVLSVKDDSVVTSGIYERYFEENGHIYHHIIDGTTGYPVDNDLASVTVVCSNSMKADILSTALLCMGSEKALEYARRESLVKVILITRDGEFIETNPER